VEVLLLKVGLPFKADVPVTLIKTPVPSTFQQPFQEVQRIEKHQQQFRLLPEVNAFVVNQRSVLPQGRVPKDNKRPQAETHIIPIEKMPDYDNHPG
jgi:hypothetical protein